MDVDSFIGLDCRLKISGMVADLFMMEILNSAMDDAYGRICSDKGDLGRLNDRSRFCQLAIVQLEWCLRFVQEEVDIYIVESGRGREKLVRDLQDTRDKMQMRMEEIEEEIKEKDSELMERTGVERELRRELKRLRKKVGEIGGEGEETDEVDTGFWNKKCHVEEQMERVERGRIRILEEDKNLNLVDAAADAEVDFVNDCIGVEIDQIKGKVVENLDMVDTEVPVSKTTLEEKQQWTTGQVENKMLAVLVSNFLTNTWNEFSNDSSDKGLFSRDSLHMDWSQFSKELVRLEEQLEVLSANCNANSDIARSSRLQKRTLKTTANHDRVDESRNNEEYGGCSPSKVEQLQNKNLCEENVSIHASNFVANLVRNREPIIRRKVEEKSWRKEIFMEKRLLSMGNNKDLDFFRRNIRSVLSRIELIIKETNRLHGVSVPHDLQIDDLKNSKIKIVGDPSSAGLKEITDRNPHESRNHNFETQISDYLFAIIFREVRRQWNEDMEIVEIGKAVTENVLKTVLREIVKDFRNQNSQKYIRLSLNDEEQGRVVPQTAFPEYQRDWNLNVQITSDTSNIVFCEMMKQWNDDIQSLKFQTVIKEELNQVILQDKIKDSEGTISHEENQSSFSSEKECLSEASAETVKDLSLVRSSRTNNSVTSTCVVDWDLEYLKGHVMQDPTMLIEVEDSFSLVNRKLEKTMEQITLSKMQLKELGTSLGITFDMDRDLTNSNCSGSRDGHHLIQSPVVEELYQQQILSAQIFFFQMVTGFEEVVQGKIRMSMSRLAGLEKQLDPIINQVVSLGKKKSLYENAFRRRCSDLQLAEAEVDMLGDEIDALLSMLEKIYIALKKNSSVSQQKSGNLPWLRKSAPNTSTAWDSGLLTIDERYSKFDMESIAQGFHGLVGRY